MKHGWKWCPTWTAGISTGYLGGVSTLGKIVLYRPRVQFRPTLISPQLVGFHISTCVHEDACSCTECNPAGMFVHSVDFQTANGKVKKAEESRTLAQVCSLLHPRRTQPGSPLWYSAGLLFLLRAQKSPWIIQKTTLVSFNKGTEFGSHGHLGWCLKPLVANVFKLLWWKVQISCKWFIYLFSGQPFVSFLRESNSVFYLRGFVGTLWSQRKVEVTSISYLYPFC